MFKFSSTLSVVTALVFLTSSASAATFIRPLPPCSVGSNCTLSTSRGTVNGTCQNSTSSVPTCVSDTPERREIFLAGNPDEACDNSTHFGVGHDCAWNTPDGVSEGTCQSNGTGNLTCVANTPGRRSILLAGPTDPCGGPNNYGVGHSCAYSGPNGVVEGTCQNDASGGLTCVANSAGRRSILLAGNPVDACNGGNNYGVGHSCAYSSPDGTVDGTCANNASGDLVCVPN